MPHNQQNMEGQDERWWENSPMFSTQHDFPGLEQPPDQMGIFWEALNIGVQKKVWKLAFDLFRVFRSLPAEEGEIFFMRIVEGKSFRQIADDLDITHRTARRKFDRASRRIKDMVSSGYRGKYKEDLGLR